MRYEQAVEFFDGEKYTLRELSAGAVEAIERVDAGTAQALAMVGLSICDDQGKPKFEPEQVEEAVAWARALPMRVIREHLAPACERLNSSNLDDARGN